MIKNSKEERLKREKKQNSFLQVLCWLFGSSAILLLLLAFISLCCQRFNICFHHFYDLAELFVITFSLSIAIKTYQRSKKVDEADMLLHLRELLDSKDNMLIHKELLGQGELTDNNSKKQIKSFWTEHEAETYNYLGTLELMDIMLEDGILEEEDFVNQFKYRIENVANNKDLMTFLSQEKENSYWTHLLSLINKYGNSICNSK